MASACLTDTPIDQSQSCMAAGWGVTKLSRKCSLSIHDFKFSLNHFFISFFLRFFFPFQNIQIINNNNISATSRCQLLQLNNVIQPTIILVLYRMMQFARIIQQDQEPLATYVFALPSSFEWLIYLCIIFLTLFDFYF